MIEQFNIFHLVFIENQLKPRVYYLCNFYKPNFFLHKFLYDKGNLQKKDLYLAQLLTKSYNFSSLFETKQRGCMFDAKMPAVKVAYASYVEK